MNKSSGYSYEPSRGSYGRSYAPAEPEWYTEGPVSQSDTIELHGFDGESSRTRHTSGSDVSHDDGQLDAHKSKADQRSVDDRSGGKLGNVKNMDTSLGRNRNIIGASDTASDAVLEGERPQESDCGMYCMRLKLFIIDWELQLKL